MSGVYWSRDFWRGVLDPRRREVEPGISEGLTIDVVLSEDGSSIEVANEPLQLQADHREMADMYAGFGGRPEIVDALLQKDALYYRLFSRHVSNINIPRTELGCRMIWCLSKVRWARGHNHIANDSAVKTLALGEIFGTALGNDVYLPAVDANTKITECIAYLNVADNVDALEFPRHADDLTEANLLNYLRGICTDEAYVGIKGLNALCTIVVSYAKKGNCTSDYIAKVRSGVREDTGVAPSFTTRDVADFHIVYGSSVQYANIRALFETWAQLIPASSIRLHTTILQASKSGMTSFYTIREAMTKFARPLFWHWISLIFPLEWDNYANAIAVVGQDEYYGYRRDLGIAKSTNYKSLGWTAAQVKTLVFGDRDILAYAGWVPPPLAVATKIKQEITRQIDTAVPEIGEDTEHYTLIMAQFTALPQIRQ